jgi:hypothetical protein
MWAVPLGEQRYRIDNIPFYATGISDGDVVSAEFEDDFGIAFRAIIEPSHFSTVRIRVKNESEKQPARDYFKQMGCDSEGMDGRLFTLSIPREKLTEVMAEVHAGEASGEWDWEEGVIRF